MGQKKVTIVGDEIKEVKEETKKNEVGVHMDEKPETTEGKTKKPKNLKTKKQVKKIRGKNYQNMKAKVDPQKKYSANEASKLLKETSLTSFDGSAEIHLTVAKKGLKGEVNLPHFQGKEKKVVICDDKVLEQIENNKINFDVLLASPAFMPKLVKYAKVLGPKGLMPNPKNGTVVEKPEEVIKSFQKASMVFKTEANAPLIHAVFGKISQKETELAENLKAYLDAVGPKNIKKAVVKSTMGPGIKIAFDN